MINSHLLYQLSYQGTEEENDRDVWLYRQPLKVNFFEKIFGLFCVAISFVNCVLVLELRVAVTHNERLSLYSGAGCGISWLNLSK